MQFFQYGTKLAVLPSVQGRAHQSAQCGAWLNAELRFSSSHFHHPSSLKIRSEVRRNALKHHSQNFLTPALWSRGCQGVNATLLALPCQRISLPLHSWPKATLALACELAHWTSFAMPARWGPAPKRSFARLKSISRLPHSTRKHQNEDPRMAQDGILKASKLASSKMSRLLRCQVSPAEACPLTQTFDSFAVKRCQGIGKSWDKTKTTTNFIIDTPCQYLVKINTLQSQEFPVHLLPSPEGELRGILHGVEQKIKRYQTPNTREIYESMFEEYLGIWMYFKRNTVTNHY